MVTSIRKGILYLTAQANGPSCTATGMYKSILPFQNACLHHLQYKDDMGPFPLQGIKRTVVDGDPMHVAASVSRPGIFRHPMDKVLAQQLNAWDESIDMVHMDGLTPETMAALLSKHISLLPKVLSLPDGLMTGSRDCTEGKQQQLDEIVRTSFTFILFGSARQRDEAVGNHGVPFEKTRVIPFGDDPMALGQKLNNIYMDTMAINGKLAGERPYQQCTHCVLDTRDEKDLQFDENGVCSYCNKYRRTEPNALFKGKDRKVELEKLVARIKQERKHSKYDCLLGVSGGIDSSYVALKLKELGLNVLLVHVDNGYNSELSNNNVQAVADHLGFDLHNYVMEWEEFRDIQLAFLRASVKDIELVTDHAVVAYMFNLADKLGIHYLISGHNYATEGVLPLSWYHEKMDLLNIKSIAHEFAGRRLRSLPRLSLLRKRYLIQVKGIKGISLLNYIDYDSRKAKEEIMSKLGWKDYGGKHTESIFTRFYQNYILPTKFNIDKRKAHLSSLICSGIIDRKTALAELSKPISTPEEIQADMEFVTKKLGISLEEFHRLMQAPVREHTEFPSYTTRHYHWERQLSAGLRPLTQWVKRRQARRHGQHD